MDRQLMERHLTTAERHIAQGQALLARQEFLILGLDRRGSDTVSARAILVTMRRTQSLHVQDRGEF